MDKKKIIKELKKRRNEIAKSRDALREIYEEIETELDSYDRGLESLECAIDYFSEVV